MHLRILSETGFGPAHQKGHPEPGLFQEGHEGHLSTEDKDFPYSPLSLPYDGAALGSENPPASRTDQDKGALLVAHRVPSSWLS